MTTNISHEVDSPERPGAIRYFLKRGTAAITTAIYASLLSFAIVDPSLWRDFGYLLVLAVPLIGIISLIALAIGGIMEIVALLTESRRRRTVAVGTTIPFVMLSIPFVVLSVLAPRFTPLSLIERFIVVLPLTPVIVFGVVNWRYWTTLAPTEKKKKR